MTCACVLRSDGGVSVIGACGCPIHGMKNLRACLARIVDLYRDEDGDLVVKAGASVADDALIAAVEALTIPDAARAGVPAAEAGAPARPTPEREQTTHMEVPR